MVGIALAPETGGTSLITGGAIGAAGIISGGVTWGIMQNRINAQFKEISKDQNEIASDKRQIIALQALSSGTTNAADSLVLASTSCPLIDPIAAPARPDNMEGNSGAAYNTAQLITIACHSIVNTTFIAPDPKPTWFDDLNENSRPR